MKSFRILTLSTVAACAGVVPCWAADQEKPPVDGARKPPVRRDGDRPPGGPGMPDGPRREMPPKFSDIDADQSGDVSQEEWVAFHVKRAEQRSREAFGFMDANKDGKLVEAELPKPRMDGEGPPREGGRPGPRPEGDARGPRRPPAEGDRPGPRPGGDGQVPKRPPLEGAREGDREGGR
ncbi:MAG: hypothetical protein KGS60_06270 [Verrucomicrobia bacterium]|nr:hypothetical protein [Verrucomicrobiota bacterium]